MLYPGRRLQQTFNGKVALLDALPCDPRQDVRWLSSGAAPLIGYAFRRVRRGTSTDAFQTCDAGRARVPLPSEAGRPDMTIKRFAADRTGARPSYGAGGRAARSCYFLGLHTLRNNILPVSPFLERFLDSSVVLRILCVRELERL